MTVKNSQHAKLVFGGGYRTAAAADSQCQRHGCPDPFAIGIPMSPTISMEAERGKLCIDTMAE